MKNVFWALERAFHYIFFCSEKEQKKDVASIPSANKWRGLSGIAKEQSNLQGIADEGGFLVGLNLK